MQDCVRIPKPGEAGFRPLFFSVLDHLRLTIYSLLMAYVAWGFAGLASNVQSLPFFLLLASKLSAHFLPTLKVACYLLRCVLVCLSRFARRARAEQFFVVFLSSSNSPFGFASKGHPQVEVGGACFFTATLANSAE